MKAADQLGVDHLQMLVQSLAIGVEVGEILDRQDTVSQIDVEQLLAVGSGEELVHGLCLQSQRTVRLGEMGLQACLQEHGIFHMVAGQSAKRTVGHDIRQLRQLIHGVGVRAGHMRHVEDLQQGAIGDGLVGEDPVFHQITREKAHGTVADLTMLGEIPCEGRTCYCADTHK